MPRNARSSRDYQYMDEAMEHGFVLGIGFASSSELAVLENLALEIGLGILLSPLIGLAWMRLLNRLLPAPPTG